MDAGVDRAARNDIPPAGILGRVGKLAVGGIQVWYSILALRHFRQLVTPSLDPELWLLVGFAFLLLPFAVNLGYRRVLRTGWKPLWLALAITAVVALMDFLLLGTFWGPVTASWILAVTVYVHLHVGLSHLLAALTGLSGCEMRVIPYYLTRMRAGTEPASLCVCPGCWTPIDRWEARLKEGLT